MNALWGLSSSINTQKTNDKIGNPLLKRGFLFLRRDMFNRSLVLKELEESEDYEKIGGNWFYTGKLTKIKNKTRNSLAYKAYRLWGKQGERCYNPNNCSYVYYGVKNIKRVWNSREFINWFLNNILSRENWEDPVVSRKKDEGDYFSENCELLERSENSKKVKKARKKIKNLNSIELSIVRLLKKNKIDDKIIDAVKYLFI